MSKCCEECEEISMWNLYKFMSFESFAAKCKYHERKKNSPSDFSGKSRCSEVKSSSQTISEEKKI